MGIIVKDIGPVAKRVEPEEVAKALGAEEMTAEETNKFRARLKVRILWWRQFKQAEHLCCYEYYFGDPMDRVRELKKEIAEKGEEIKKRREEIMNAKGPLTEEEVRELEETNPVRDSEEIL